jgi:hypothetical protein
MSSDSIDPFVKMTIVSIGLWVVIGIVALVGWLITQIASPLQ